VAERGELQLFALVLRENALDLWDLLIVAPWTQVDSLEPYEYVANKLKRFLNREELLQISHIAFPDSDSEWVRVLTHTFQGNGNGVGLIHIGQLNVGNIAVRDLYLFACPSHSGAGAGAA
jgi:hypothetical protein